MLVGTVDLRTPFLGDGGFRVLAHQKTRILCSFLLARFDPLQHARQVAPGLVLGFVGSFVHIRRHLESCSQDLLRQERR